MDRRLKRMLLVAPATIPFVFTSAASVIVANNNIEYLNITDGPWKGAWEPVYNNNIIDFTTTSSNQVRSRTQDWTIVINNSMGDKVGDKKDKRGIITITSATVTIEIPKNIPISLVRDRIWISIDSPYSSRPDGSGYNRWGAVNNHPFVYNDSSKKWISERDYHNHNIGNANYIGAVRGGSYIQFGDDNVYYGHNNAYNIGTNWGNHGGSDGPDWGGFRRQGNGQRNDRIKIDNIHQPNDHSISFDIKFANDLKRINWEKNGKVTFKFKTKINENFYTYSSNRNYGAIKATFNIPNTNGQKAEQFSQSYNIGASDQRIITVKSTKQNDAISREINDVPNFSYTIKQDHSRVSNYANSRDKIILNTRYIPSPLTNTASKLDASSTRFSNSNLNKKYRVVSNLTSNHFTVDNPVIDNSYRYIYTNTYKEYIKTRNGTDDGSISRLPYSDDVKNALKDTIDRIYNDLNGNDTDDRNLGILLDHWNKALYTAIALSEIYNNGNNLETNIKTKARNEIIGISKDWDKTRFDNKVDEVKNKYITLNSKVNDLKSTLSKYKDVLNTDNYTNSTNKQTLDTVVRNLFSDSNAYLSGSTITTNTNFDNIKLKNTSATSTNIDTKRQEIEMLLNQLNGAMKLTEAFMELDAALLKANILKNENDLDPNFARDLQVAVDTANRARSTYAHNAVSLSRAANTLDQAVIKIKAKYAEASVEKFNRTKKNNEVNTNNLNNINNNLKNLINKGVIDNNLNNKADETLRELKKSIKEDIDKTFDKALEKAKKLNEKNQNNPDYSAGGNSSINSTLHKAIQANQNKPSNKDSWTKENIKDVVDKTKALQDATHKALVDMLEKQKTKAQNIINELNKTQYNKEPYRTIKNNLTTKLNDAKRLNTNSNDTELENKLNDLTSAINTANTQITAANNKTANIEKLKQLINTANGLKTKVETNTNDYPSTKLNDLKAELTKNNHNNYNSLTNEEIESRINTLNTKTNDFLNDLLDKQTKKITSLVNSNNPRLEESTKQTLNNLKNYANTAKTDLDLTSKSNKLDTVVKGIKVALSKDSILKKLNEATNLSNDTNLTNNNKRELLNKITEVKNAIASVNNSTDLSTLNNQKSTLDTNFTKINKALDKAKIDIAKEKLNQTIAKAKEVKETLKDNDIKTDLNSNITSGENAKNSSNATEASLNAANDKLNKDLTIALAKQTIKDATSTNDDLINKDVDLSDLNTKKNKLNNLITNPSSSNQAINDAKKELDTAIDLAKTIAKAKEAIKKVNPANSNTKLADSINDNNDLKESLKAVDNAKATLDNSINSSNKNKNTIETNTLNLNNAIDNAKNKIVEEVKKLTHIDDGVKTNIISNIENPNNDLTKKLEELNKAKAIDTNVDQLNKTIALANKNKDNNNLRDKNLNDLNDAIANANAALNTNKDNPNGLIEANKTLNKAIVSANVDQVVDDANKVIDRLNDLNLNDAANDLKNKVNQLVNKAINVNNINEIEPDLTKVKELIDLNQTKIAAANTLNKVNDKNHWNDTLTITDPNKYHDLNNSINELNTAKSDLLNTLKSTTSTKDDINNKTTTLNNSIDKVKNKILDIVKGLTSIDPVVKNQIINNIKNDTNNIGAKLKELDKALKINKSSSDLKKSIELAKETKLDNDLKDTNLTDINSAILEATNALVNHKDDFTKLDQANSELNKAVIDANVNQIEDDANKVIKNLSDLGLDQKVNKLQKALNDLKEKANNASSIKDIETNIDNIKGLIGLDNTKANAIKLLNKINDIDHWNNNLTIADTINHPDLVVKINDLNNAKDTLISAIEGTDESIVKQKTQDLTTKLQEVKNQLTLEIAKKDNVPGVIVAKFKDYINDSNTNLNDALKAFDKLDKLNLVDKEVQDQITKYQNLKNNNSINYDLSSQDDKNAFDNSLSNAKDLYDYIKDEITSANDQIVTSDEVFEDYLAKLNAEKDNLKTSWDNLTGNKMVDKATKDFIKSLSDAFDTKKAIMDNGFDNNSALDNLYNKLSNKDTNSNIKTINDLTDHSSFTNDNITLDIDMVDKYNKLVKDTNELNKVSKLVTKEILNQENNKVINERAKYDSNGEYDLDKYHNDDFNNLKDQLDNLINNKQAFDQEIVNKNNVEIVNKAKEIKDSLIKIQFNTNQAKAKVSIDQLQNLDTTIKNQLKDQINNAQNDTQINDIVSKAMTLNNLYQRLKDKLQEYNTVINNDILFKNSSKNLQQDLMNAFNLIKDSNLINNLNDVLGTSLDENDVLTKINNLTNAINALDGIARLKQFKNGAKVKINNLSSLNNAQKTALINQVLASDLIDQITGVNQNINLPDADSILDLANKLNDKMQELNNFVNPSDQTNTTNGIIDSYKDHTHPSYKLAIADKQQTFDNALINANNLLNKTTGNNLDISKVSDILDKLKEAKMNLETSSSSFIDKLINNIDVHLNDSLITDPLVKQDLKANIKKAILNIDSRINATDIKSQALDIINTISFINSKINKLNSTVNNNTIFNNPRFSNIGNNLKDEINKLKATVDAIIDNWKDGFGSKIENDTISKIKLDTKQNIDLTAKVTTNANDKLNAKLDSINDINLNAANKVVKSNLIFDLTKNQALKDIFKDILTSDQLNLLNSLDLANNIKKVLDLVQDDPSLLAKLKTKLELNDNETIDKVLEQLSNKLNNNKYFKELVESVINITPSALSDDNNQLINQANSILENNLSNKTWLNELANSLNLESSNIDAIKAKMQEIITNSNDNSANSKAKLNLLTKLQEPELINNLNNKLTEIFNTESKEYALSLINKDNFKYLSDNEITNFINEIKDANIDLTANDQSLDYNIEAIVKKAQLLDLANKAKLAIKNVDNGTKDLIENKINDLINEAFKLTNTKELVKNDPTDLLNTSKQKLINAELNLDKLNATTSNLINKINLANNAKTTVDYLNAKDYTNDPVVDSTNRINFDNSLANALAHTKDLANENVDDQINKPNNLVISIPNISDDNLFTAGGIENTNDNETKSINSELNDLSSDLVAKTNALDGQEILQAARVNATNIINSLTNLSNKLKQELINQVNTVESNPLVDDIVNHAKELNDKYIELNNLLKLKDIIANTNHWINNTNTKDNQNLKDVIDQMINNLLDNNGLMPNHLGNIDNLTAINDNINQLRSLLNENNDNPNGLNGWNNTIAKSNEIIDSLFNTALDTDKVSNEDLTKLNDGYKAILKDIIDNEITKAKTLENELLDLKKQYESTTDADTKAKLNQAINDKQNQINAIKDQYLNALTNARSKNRLRDLINQANDWLNNNTSSKQTVLRGNLPAMIEESLNHLLDLTNDNNQTDIQIDKISKNLEEAKTRYIRLNQNIKDLNDLINQAKDYISKITPGSSLIDQLLNSIHQAESSLNNDDSTVIDLAHTKLANDLANIMLKNQIEKAKALKESLINNLDYQPLVNKLNNAIDQANNLLNQVNNILHISDQLRDLEITKANELELTIAKVKLNKTIIDSNNFVNTLSDSKFNNIKSSLINAINQAQSNINNKSSDLLLKENDKLANDLANAKLDKVNLELNDLIKKLNQASPKYIDIVSKLNKIIKDANNINRSNTTDVEQSVVKLNNALNQAKVNKTIKDANNALTDLNHSLVDQLNKNQLNQKINDLIKKLNNSIKNNDLNSNKIDKTIQKTNQVIQEINNQIAKAKFNDAANKANKLINDNQFDPIAKDQLKNNLTKAKNDFNTTNTDKIINNLADKLINDLAKAKLLDQINKSNQLLKTILNDSNINLIPKAILQPIINDLTNNINLAKQKLRNNLNNDTLDQARITLANKTKAINKLINQLVIDLLTKINNAINVINQAQNLEPELKTKLSNQAKTLYNDQDFNDLINKVRSLDKLSKDLIDAFIEAKNIQASDIYIKTAIAKKSLLDDAIAFVEQNQLLGINTKGNSEQIELINSAIEQLKQGISSIDGKGNKTPWWLIITSILGSITFIFGSFLALIKKKKDNKDK
ncbi:hypothetical protein GE118_02300 [Mycoplasma sp. NEAQ87857]|uniref:hypothetical protein n=1 Tax=Mycoplasma sp. NEAQ87857 TaxID=2683967 RepID=UPI0013160118|nr:hypothetical protein [Mycoplasma sp. NEAQ87857]QGZ97625.1 hypothetical protein GE118_02300 [Mycoplasma sp. NEAQ87857]